MIDHPRLTSTVTDEPALAVTLDPSSGPTFAQPTRETFVLSTRASGLVADGLGYSEREEIASVTAKVLFLTGGAYVPEKKLDPIETVQRLHPFDGGKHPTDDEIERVAAYLKNSEIEQRVRWLAADLVSGSRLSEAMSTDEIRTKRERTNGLRGIAKDL